jgi:drug/metabolite transporter (DMT)-like permease
MDDMRSDKPIGPGKAVGPGEAWALAALIAGALSIAFAPIFVRVSETGPVATAFWRVLLSLPLVALWARAETARPAVGSKPPKLLLAVAGLFFAGDLGLWHLSIAMTSVANSTFLVNLAPILVGLAAWVPFGERLRLPYFAGLAVAVVGAGLLVRASLGFNAGGVRGDAVALVAAFLYAGYQLTVKQLRLTCSTAQIMLGGGIVASPALLVMAVALDERLVPATGGGWLALVGVALICQLAGQSLITYAMAHLPTALSSISLLVQPVAAALLAWTLFGERLGVLQCLGGAAVLAGIGLARTGTGKRG